MSKHTPGPWETYTEETRCYGQLTGVRVANSSQGICGLLLHNGENNARLIAAAPELLEACKRALPWVGRMIADSGHLQCVAPNDAIGAMQQLESVIAKAEGK